MEDEKRIYEMSEMSNLELAQMLIQHPEMADEIMAVTDNLSELYEFVQDELIPDGLIYDDGDIRENVQVRQALQTISDYLHEDFDDWEQYEDFRQERKEREYFFEELDHEIGYGATPEQLREFCERYGYNFDEIYSTETLKDRYKYYGYDYNIDSNSVTRIVKDKEQGNNAFSNWLEGGKKTESPLKDRETELASLEAEEKTIAETEALIDRQTQKEGQDIGEN